VFQAPFVMCGKSSDTLSLLGYDGLDYCATSSS